MIRAYRFALTVYIDGDATTLPEVAEIAEHVATQVQDAEDHDLACHVRPIETEDYDQENPGRDNYPKTKGLEVNYKPRRRKPVCGDERYKDACHPEDGKYRCQRPPGHDGSHRDTRDPMHPEWN